MAGCGSSDVEHGVHVSQHHAAHGSRQNVGLCRHTGAVEEMVRDTLSFLFFCNILRRLIWGRAVMFAAVASNVVAVAGSALPAVTWIRSADMFGQASVLFAQNKTALGFEMYLQAQKQNQIAYSLAPIYYYAEVVILLLILATFCAVGIACARRISFALRGVRKIAASRIYAPKTSQVFEQAAVEGERLRLHILGTTAFIFVTFLLRSFYSTMRLVAHQLQDNSKSCPGSALGACDASCHNVYASWPLPLCIFVTFFPRALATTAAFL